MRKNYTRPSFLTVALSVLVVLLAGILAFQYIVAHQNGQEKARDAIRLSDFDQIHQALTGYYNKNGAYPVCLYKQSGCTTTLEGGAIMPVVAVDPLTKLQYVYASYGKGAQCTGFHLGISLERSGSQALLTGSDAPPQPDSALCAGSAHDFSGLSFAPGGQPCDTSVGTPQPTDATNGETCYDILRNKPLPVQ